MYISKKDLETLQKIEGYLFPRNLELYFEMYNLTEKLIRQKEKNNKASWERIKAKKKNRQKLCKK